MSWYFHQHRLLNDDKKGRFSTCSFPTLRHLQGASVLFLHRVVSLTHGTRLVVVPFFNIPVEPNTSCFSSDLFREVRSIKSFIEPSGATQLSLVLLLLFVPFNSVAATIFLFSPCLLGEDVPVVEGSDSAPGRLGSILRSDDEMMETPLFVSQILLTTPFLFSW